MNMHDDADLPATRPLATPPRPGGDPRAIATRRASSCKRAKRPCFLVGTQLRWSPARERVAAALERFGAPVYLNGMARGALPSRASAPLQPLAALRARAGRRRASCSARRSTSASTTAARRRGARARRSSRSISTAPSSAATAASTSAIHGDSGIVLEQLARELGRRSSTSRVARGGARRRGQAAREDAAGDRVERLAAEPAARLRRARQAPRAERHRDRRRRRLRRDGGLRAQARVAAALDGPGPARHARRRSRLRDGGEARAAGRERRARLRRRQLRPPRASSSRRWRARTSRSSRVIGNDAAWTQIRRGQVEIYGAERAVATALEYTRYEKVVEALRRPRLRGSRRSRSSARRSTRPSPAGSRRAST